MEDMNLPTVGAAENTAADTGVSVDETEEGSSVEAVTETERINAEAKPEALPSPKTARLTYSSYAEMRPSPSSKYAPMSLGGYILMLIIALIPGVGFIASAIIACSSKKLARQRLALAIVLITTVLIVILGALAFVVIYVFDVDVVGEVISFFKR